MYTIQATSEFSIVIPLNKSSADKNSNTIFYLTVTKNLLKSSSLFKRLLLLKVEDYFTPLLNASPKIKYAVFPPIVPSFCPHKKGQSS